MANPEQLACKNINVALAVAGGHVQDHATLVELGMQGPNEKATDPVRTHRTIRATQEVANANRGVELCNGSKSEDRFLARGEPRHRDRA